MARGSELREQILSVFEDGIGLLPKEVIEAVHRQNKEVPTKQIHNFLGNHYKSGLFQRDEQGRYYLKRKAEGGLDMELENKMINAFKSEIEEICDKYMKNLENPFDKFDGASLLQAKNLYTYIKKVKRSL